MKRHDTEVLSQDNLPAAGNTVLRGSVSPRQHIFFHTLQISPLIHPDAFWTEKSKQEQHVPTASDELHGLHTLHHTVKGYLCFEAVPSQF